MDESISKDFSFIYRYYFFKIDNLIFIPDNLQDLSQKNLLSKLIKKSSMLSRRFSVYLKLIDFAAPLKDPSFCYDYYYDLKIDMKLSSPKKFVRAKKKQHFKT